MESWICGFGYSRDNRHGRSERYVDVVILKMWERRLLCGGEYVDVRGCKTSVQREDLHGEHRYSGWYVDMKP